MIMGFATNCLDSDQRVLFPRRSVLCPKDQMNWIWVVVLRVTLCNIRHNLVYIDQRSSDFRPALDVDLEITMIG